MLDLAEKLLTTLHLNVAERASLPAGEMPFSALLQAAQKTLAVHHFMPPQFRPDDKFTGVLIELRGEQVFVHERHEIGVMRLSPTTTERVANLKTALQLFIKANGGEKLDDVRIAYDP